MIQHFVDGLCYGLVGFGAALSFVACLAIVMGLALLLMWAASGEDEER